MPVDVGERERGRVLARLLDHRGGEVDAGRVAAHLREGCDHQPWPAATSEHCVVGACAGKFDEQAQCLLVAHRGRVRERGCLTRELVDDDVGVRAVTP